MKLGSVNSVNLGMPNQNNPQNFGAVKVNAEALDCLRLSDESHIPGSLRFLLSTMKQKGAISQISHNAYKHLLGENDIVLSKQDISALKKAVKKSDADTTIHRLIGARFFDLSVLLPKGRDSVVDMCYAKMERGEINTYGGIPKAIKTMRMNILQEANLAPISNIKGDFEREVTLRGVPQLVVNA